MAIIITSRDRRIKALQTLAPDAPARAKGLQPHEAETIRNILTALGVAADLTTAGTTNTSWRLHQYSGKAPQPWSIDVLGNTRLIFFYDEATKTASSMEYKDPHGKTKR